MTAPDRSLVVSTAGPEETRAVGIALAKSLAGAPAPFLSFEGPLGAGKTVLIRGICEGLGVTDPVTSPTYTLENEYETAGGRPVLHLDCFRLAGARDLEDLGLDDRLRDDPVVLVEWGDRVIDALPPETLRVKIEAIGETRRRIAICIPEWVSVESLEEGI